jgi:hypothetical protein
MKRLQIAKPPFADIGLVHPRNGVLVKEDSKSFPDARGKPIPTDLLQRLSEGERAQLRECERILENGLGEFFQVGNALLRIRDNRLYRDTYATFEQYCRARWGFGRTYAWRVITATERVKLLPTNDSVPKPANEFQVRPLLGLKPEDFPKAWGEIVKRSGNEKISPRVLLGRNFRLLKEAWSVGVIANRVRGYSCALSVGPV